MAVLGWVVAGVLLLVIGYLIGRGNPVVVDESTAARPTSTTSKDDGPTIAEPSRGPDADAPLDGQPAFKRDRNVSEESLVETEIPVVFEPPLLDFDLVEPDEEMSGTVVIRNVGTEPLTIQRMVSSCKCTTAEDLSGTVIPPGGSRAFTAVMEAPSYAGAKKEQIRFLFAGYGVHNFQLRAMVSRAVFADPPFLTVTDRYSGTFLLRSLDDRPFRVLAVNDNEPIYAGSFNPASDELQSHYELVWDLTRYDPDTCLDDAGNRMPMWLVVETDHPQAPIVDMRIRHVPCTMIETPQPGRLWVLSELREVVGELQPGESHEFAVSMKWLRGEAPNDEIGRVESQIDQFSAELLEVTREGDTITARVRVTASKDHRGLIYGDLRLFGQRFPMHSCALKIIGRVAEDARRQARHD
jgi:hypothetical protein